MRSGSLAPLLAGAAWQGLHASRFNETYADASEAVSLAEEFDQPVTAAQALGVLTWVSALRGEESRCREYGEETQRRAAELGFKLYGLLASLCFGLLDLGLRPGGAGHRRDRGRGPACRRAARSTSPGSRRNSSSPRRTFAAGRPRTAEAILAAFDSSQLATVPLFRAQAERCRGLLADADGFEAHFAPHWTSTPRPRARSRSPGRGSATASACGARGGASRRASSCEPHSRRFDRVGAAPWSERVGAELRASGETLRRRESHEAEELTPQELQIALQVAEGKSNKEVGAALFLSHKTIEFHLSRIYRKLDIHSRAELIRLYASEPALTSGAAG